MYLILMFLLPLFQRSRSRERERHGRSRSRSRSRDRETNNKEAEKLGEELLEKQQLLMSQQEEMASFMKLASSPDSDAEMKQVYQQKVSIHAVLET